MPAVLPWWVRRPRPRRPDRAGTGEVQAPRRGPRRAAGGEEPAPDGQPAPDDQPLADNTVFELFWHGEKYDRELRSWLVKDLIFEIGQGLAAGQWGTAKTFAVLDLAASVMTGTRFAGREVVRKGGVVFVAAEGAGEIPIRLEGLVEQKLRPEALERGASSQGRRGRPGQASVLLDRGLPEPPRHRRLQQAAGNGEARGQEIHDQFALPLAMIVIDTLSAAGNFKDANDAAEGQRIMNKLGELSRQTGAFVLAVDHFGKAVETGTRGSSAKEAAADVVLALLADRETNGTVSNMRMALRKLRGGKVGTETPFELRIVNAGFGETTCVVEWKVTREATPGAAPARGRWPRALKIFQAAFEFALAAHGKEMNPYSDQPEMPVQVVPRDAVREEFVKRYPSDAEDPRAKSEAKRKAFDRSLKSALGEKELVLSWEIDGVDYVWLAGSPGKPKG